MSGMRTCGLAGGLLLLAGWLAGCAERPLPPPMTFRQVAAEVNSNNDLLPALKGSIQTVGGELVDKDGNRQNLDLLGLNGLLIYAQPGVALPDGQQRQAILDVDQAPERGRQEVLGRFV